MKKLFVLFAFMGLVSFTVNAQQCSAKKSTSTVKVESNEAIAKAASLDTDIEQRVCEKSGEVSYVRKNVCQYSGSVSYTDVEYDASTKKFVNVSPSAKGKAKKNCAASCAAKKGAKATKVSSTKKACTAAEKAACAKKTGSNGCSAKKGSATSAATGKVKLVKGEGEE